jgi:hypothetical protein
MPYSVMLARFPGGNAEHPASADYVINLMETLHNDDRIETIRSWYKADTPIPMVRNLCVKHALALKVDYLLMIDADISPDCEPGAKPFWPTAWDFLMERRQIEADRAAGKATRWCDDEAPKLLGDHKDPPLPPATVAAPYCGPPPHECVYVFEWASKENVEGGNPNFKLQMFDRSFAAQQAGIQEVAALPTGLILYDTRVFRRLPAPWFDYEYTDPPYNTEKATTEDVYQTRNASMLGLPQFCAWDSWAAHLKLKTVTKPRVLTIHSVRKSFADACLAARARGIVGEKP